MECLANNMDHRDALGANININVDRKFLCYDEANVLFVLFD